MTDALGDIALKGDCACSRALESQRAAIHLLLYSMSWDKQWGNQTLTEAAWKSGESDCHGKLGEGARFNFEGVQCSR